MVLTWSWLFKTWHVALYHAEKQRDVNWGLMCFQIFAYGKARLATTILTLDDIYIAFGWWIWLYSRAFQVKVRRNFEKSVREQILDRKTDRRIEKLTEGQTERQTDGQVDRQMDRKTDKWTER